MMTMWCTGCGREHSDTGTVETVCCKCGCSLSIDASLSATPDESSELNESNESPPYADATEVFAASERYCQMAAAQLRSAGIPAVVFGPGSSGHLSAVQFSQGSRLMVRKADVAAAREVLLEIAELQDDPQGGFSDDELAALSEAAALDPKSFENGAVL